MKSLIEKILVGSGVDSALRSGLGVLGALLLANGATELPGEGAAGIDTILELITGGVAVAAYIGLKVLDGTKFGGLAGSLIGPRVGSVTQSAGRWILTMLNGALLGIGVPSITDSPDAAGWVVALVLWGVDRLWSAKERSGDDEGDGGDPPSDSGRPAFIGMLLWVLLLMPVMFTSCSPQISAAMRSGVWQGAGDASDGPQEASRTVYPDGTVVIRHASL